MKRGSMFNRRFKNSTKIMYGALAAILFFSTLLVTPFNQVNAADSCPVFYNFGGQFPRPGYTTYHTSDVSTKSSVSYNHTFAEGGYSVSINAEANMRTNVFSQIFLNYYNVMGVFTNALVTDPEYVNPWKTLCISRDGIGKNTVTVSETGVIRYLKSTTRKLGDGESIPPDASGCDTTPPYGTVNGDEDCEVTEEKPTDSSPIDDTDVNSFAIPYPDGIGDLAQKIPSVISLTKTFCTPGDATRTCSAGYVCVEVPEDKRSAYYGIADNTGTCNTIGGAQATAELPFPANLLCKADKFIPPTTALDSKVCYSQPSVDPVYTQQVYENPDSPNLIDPLTLPFLKRASVHAPTNKLDFDIEAAEEYFNKNFIEKLGLYDDEEADWFLNLPAQTHLSYDPKSGTTNVISPWSSDDYIPKLGGYAEVASDTRFVNPGLLPIGSQVVTTLGHYAYFRGGNGYNGALFVDGHPYGHRLDVPQHWPAIDANYGQVAVAAAVDKNPDSKKGVFVTTTNYAGGALQKIVKVADGEFYGTPAIFVRSNGEKVLFSNINGTYKYFTSSQGVFIENSPAKSFLNNRVEWAVRIAIDSQDNIHVLWCDKDSCPRILYSKLSFNGDNLQTVVANEVVPFKGPVVGLVNTIPFGIQTDQFGNALIVGRLGSNDNNRLVFLARSPSGQWSPEETITGKVIGNVETEFELFSSNAMPKVASVVRPDGNIDTIVVFQVYTGNPKSKDSDDERQTTQIFYSMRRGPVGGTGVWSKPIKASDVVDLDWQTRIHDESIDKSGHIAFTVQERTSKYNQFTRLFDAGGIKMCMIPANGVDNLTCGKNYNGSGIGYVYPPTETDDKKMHVVNPWTGAEML